MKPGETYFVGGGLPHALGEGCFVIEVQEPSDITVIPLTPRKRYETFGVPAGKGPAAPAFTAEDERLYDERTLGTFVYGGCDGEENLRRWRIPPGLSAGGTGARNTALSARRKPVSFPAPGWT